MAHIHPKAMARARQEHAISWPFSGGEQAESGQRPENGLPPHSELDIEEEMLDLYTTVTALVSASGGKIIQFIGSREGEGTSTLIKEFARVACIRFNQSVFLLDIVSYMSPQRYNQACGLEVVEQGTDLMAEILCELVDSRFLVWPLPKVARPLTEVVGSPHIDSVFSKLRQQFDLILIDSPPVMCSGVGLALVHKADGVLLVVEADKTRWSVARHVKNRIIKAQGNILGVILNKRRYYIPSLLYRWFL